LPRELLRHRPKADIGPQAGHACGGLSQPRCLIDGLAPSDADATFVIEGNQSSMFSNGTADILFAKQLFPERFVARK
jgi:hypothetical protein